MNDEIKKERSRNYPKMSLAGALELAKKLHAKAGKAKVSPIVAVGALGYNGLNGAALGTLGTLTQYGLIDRERGKSVSVSPLTIRLIHPLSPEQEAASKRESILTPEVFKELYDGGFHKCDEALISNHLIQSGFTTDGAKKAASVFIENVSIAKLGDDSIIDSNESIDEDKKGGRAEDKGLKPLDPAPPIVITEQSKGKKMLAEYSVPLGANEVKIAFTGESLRPEDFDALSDYVALFKKQFERKQKSETVPKLPEPPFVAKRTHNHNETMVEIIGLKIENGEGIYQAKDGTLVPAVELFPNK